jgi:hypothetical protein
VGWKSWVMAEILINYHLGILRYHDLPHKITIAVLILREDLLYGLKILLNQSLQKKE